MYMYAALPVGSSRQEYWSGWPCPLPGDLPDPGMEPTSLTSSAGSLPPGPSGKPFKTNTTLQITYTSIKINKEIK